MTTITTSNDEVQYTVRQLLNQDFFYFPVSGQIMSRGEISVTDDEQYMDQDMIKVYFDGKEFSQDYDAHVAWVKLMRR